MHWLAIALALAGCNATYRQGPHHDVDAGHRDAAEHPDAPDAEVPVDASSDAFPAVTASQLVTKWDRNQCDGAFACKSSFTGSNSEFSNQWGSSLTNCYNHASQIDVPSVIDGDVASGVIVFDPAQGAICAVSIGYDCQTYWQSGPTNTALCEPAIIGTVADGGDCRVDWDCVHWTSYCDGDTERCTAG